MRPVFVTVDVASLFLKTILGTLFFLNVLICSAAIAPAAEDAPAAIDNKVSASVAKTSAAVTSDEIASLRDVLKSSPVAADALQLGNLLLDNGDNDEAVKAFDLALQLNPRSHDAKLGRGVALGRMGKLELAEQALRDALKLNPAPERVHYEIGILYEKRGDFSKAIAEFKEGLKKHQGGAQ